MRHHRTVLRTGTAALFAVALASAPAAAWQPTTISADLPSTEVGTLTDMAARNQRVAVSFDVSYPAGGPSSGPGFASYDNAGGVAWSTNSGETWFSNEIDLANKPTEPAVTICKGHVVLMMVVQPSGSGTYGSYQHGINISDQTVALRYWSENPQHRRVRHPDIACIANEMFAVAWFQETAGGDYTVKLRTGNQRVNHLSSVLDLGAGSSGKGLSVAATADRVYVSWFSGTKLRLARYRIGSAPSTPHQAGHVHHHHAHGCHQSGDRRGRLTGRPGIQLQPRPQGPPQHQQGRVVRRVEDVVGPAGSVRPHRTPDHGRRRRQPRGHRWRGVDQLVAQILWANNQC